MGGCCLLVICLPYAHLYWLQIQFDSPAAASVAALSGSSSSRPGPALLS